MGVNHCCLIIDPATSFNDKKKNLPGTIIIVQQHGNLSL